MGYGEDIVYGAGFYKGDEVASFVTPINRINKDTGRCLRFAVKPEQGQGFSVYSGDDWIWPEPNCKTISVLNLKDQTINLAIDETTGHFYQLDTRDGATGSGFTTSWTDKATTSDGTEIATDVRLKEDIGSKENELIEHIESHVQLRPQNADNKGASGYTSTGYRSGMEVDIGLYKDGIVAIKSRMLDIPPYGDLVVDRKTEGHRIQMRVQSNMSAFRLVSVDRTYNQKDEAHSRIAMSEHDWQAEFTAPLLWVTRGANFKINRGTGLNSTGDYDSLVTGPDSKTSAFKFLAADQLASTITAMTGDFSIMFGLSAIAATAEVLKFGNTTISLEVVGAVNTIKFADGVNTVSKQLAWDGTGWVMLKLTRSGTDLIVSEDGVLLDTLVLGSVEDLGNAIIMPGTGTIYDIRAYSSAISEGANLYYYRDVTENNGDGLLPLF